MERDQQGNPRRYYLARLDGDPVGCLGLSFEPEGAYIAGVGVLPEFRGRGYARRLLARAVNDALAAGQTRQVLEVATENANALGLYKFVRLPRRDALRLLPRRCLTRGAPGRAILKADPRGPWAHSTT